MTGKQIRLSASDCGAYEVYVTLPEQHPAPGIVMLHEVFGVTEWVKETADFFAEQGYCVAAPEMFWRQQPGFVASHLDPEQHQKGRQFKKSLDHDKAMEDIGVVIAHLKSLPECNGKIGVAGFCLGGTLAYLAAARLDVDAAVAYYGTQIHEFLSEGENITCPTVFHMGDKDDHVPKQLLDKIRAAMTGNPNITIEVYDAGHAFANTHRADKYSESASRKAHSRTFNLFDKLR